MANKSLKDRFREAVFEPKRLFDIYLSKHSSHYRSQEDEVSFTKKLMREDHTALCEYLTFKIYHFIAIFHKVYLDCFVAEFAQNEKGDWLFYDAKIYTLNSPKLDIYSMARREDVIKPAEAELEKLEDMQDRAGETLSLRHKKEQEAYSKEKEKEDSLFEQEVEVLARQGLAKDHGLSPKKTLRLDPSASKNSKVHLYLTMKENMEVRLDRVRGILSGGANRIEVMRMVEENDLVYSQLNERLGKKLSEVVLEKGYSFEKEFIKYGEPGKSRGDERDRVRLIEKLPGSVGKQKGKKFTPRQQVPYLALGEFSKGGSRNDSKEAIKESKSRKLMDQISITTTGGLGATRFDGENHHIEKYSRKSGRTGLSARKEAGLSEELPNERLPSLEKRQSGDRSLLTDLSQRYTDRGPLAESERVARERNRSELIRRKNIGAGLAEEIQRKTSAALGTSQMNSVSRALEKGLGISEIKQVRQLMKDRGLDPGIWVWKPQHKEFSAMEGVSFAQKKMMMPLEGSSDFYSASKDKTKSTRLNNSNVGSNRHEVVSYFSRLHASNKKRKPKGGSPADFIL